RQNLINYIWNSLSTNLKLSDYNLAINNYLVYIFQLDNEAAQLLYIFSHFIAISYISVGAGFIANAAFNNLGKSSYALIVNILKATIFTIPFVYFGGQSYGAEGILIGQSIGSLIIGLGAYIFAYKYIYRLKNLSISNYL
ncbi:MATE family efflux transporter, partial [Francisellaceae bacterium CB52]